MHDVIDQSDFQNSFKVLLTSITKSESSPSPSCLESSPSLSPNVWDSSPSRFISRRVSVAGKAGSRRRLSVAGSHGPAKPAFCRYR